MTRTQIPPAKGLAFEQSNLTPLGTQFSLVVCDYCDCTFSRRTALLRFKPAARRFCSTTCAGLVKRNRRITSCSLCGAAIAIKPTKGTTGCCSVECYRLHNARPRPENIERMQAVAKRRAAGETKTAIALSYAVSLTAVTHWLRQSARYEATATRVAELQQRAASAPVARGGSLDAIPWRKEWSTAE